MQSGLLGYVPSSKFKVIIGISLCKFSKEGVKKGVPPNHLSEKKLKLPNQRVEQHLAASKSKARGK